MARSENTSSSPILATIVGCLGLAFVPLLLLSAAAFLGYKYFTTREEAPVKAKPPRQSAARKFSPAEEAAIRKIFQRMGSSNPRLQNEAWDRLHRYHLKNGAAVQRLLIQALWRSRNPRFIAKTTWGLCEFYGETGRKAVVATALRKRNDPVVLAGMAKGLNALQNTALRKAMRKRVRTALHGAQSTFEELF